MSLSVDQFVAKHNNTLINNGGTQCVALANQYESEVVGAGWIGTPITGYANDWWTNFNGSSTEKANYVQVGADQKAQKGDLAIWTRYGSLPHIALVIADNGSTLNCFTQHYPSTNAVIANLNKTGLAGYLRPKAFVAQVVEAAAQVQAPAPAPSQTSMVEISGDFRTVYHLENGSFVRSGSTLAPNKEGVNGKLQYQVLARQGDFVEIPTQDFGNIWIYVGSNGGADSLTRFYTA